MAEQRIRSAEVARLEPMPTLAQLRRLYTGLLALGVSEEPFDWHDYLLNDCTPQQAEALIAEAWELGDA